MIAITGGAGAMGTRLCRLLRSQGRSVRVLDLDLPASRERMEELGVEFRGADVTDPASLEGALEGCIATIHLAGLVLARGNDYLLDRVNHQGTENVIAAARRSGVRRFVHVSSISVTYRRANAYSLSKRRSEDAVRESALDWTILRPTLAWGDTSCAEHEAFRKAVLAHRILPLPAGGRALKAPVHVDDLALAFASTLDHHGSIGRILSLSGSRTASLREMAREIRCSAGSRGIVLPVASAPMGWLARAVPPLLRRLGIPFQSDWQTFTGLVEDAAPSWTEAGERLGWTPRPWRALQ
ncbi:MAG TPA: NAD(P)H-binding protein [Fibrobacteria bacterium]|nr:NAD(P)H-binding protein [Fibrobacteria bacterium]HOX49958.1 NAD(P)H-binding protein [Fibrobacteria bacterium]